MKRPHRFVWTTERFMVYLTLTNGWVRVNGRLYEYWHRRRSFLPPRIRYRRVRVIQLGPYLLNTWKRG